MGTFIVGVSGHRPNRLPPEELPRIRIQLGEALKLLQGSRPASECMLTGGLAEGTDRLAAEIALHMSWSIEAILPFSVTRYMKDFETDQSKAEFKALMAKCKRTVAAPAADTYADQNDGYAEQGHMVAHRCDALVTVWDGKNAHGRGGTAEVIEIARKEGKRVIWIKTAPLAPFEELK